VRPGRAARDLWRGRRPLRGCAGGRLRSTRGQPAGRCGRAPLCSHVDPGVLGAFLFTFARSEPPTDGQIIDFYAQYGSLGDRDWMQRLPDTEREALPAATRLGLREPVWYLRELAYELDLCCDLFRGLRGDDCGLLRARLGPAPSSGQLVEVMLLGGRLVRVWASEEDRKRKAGSVGEWVPTQDDPGRPLSDDEARQIARSVLRSQLNRYEAQAHRQWVGRAELPVSSPPDAPGAVQPNRVVGGFRTVLFGSLIGALHLQLSDLAASEARLHRCPWCTRVFFPPRANAEFCSARCASAERQRRFRERRRQERKDSDAR